MATSVVDICNIALTRLGEDRIVSLNDSAERAILCNLNYPYARDRALRAFEWSCAIERATLSRLATDPITTDWDHQYQLPNDCLRVLNMPNVPAATWEISQRYLLTSEDTVVIRYIKRLLDPAMYDAQLVYAVAFRVGADIAYKLTHNRGKESEMEALYESVLLKAKGTTRQEISEEAEVAEWSEAF